MDKDNLIRLVSSEDGYTKEQLIKWVKALPAYTRSRSPSDYKIGDVFMHPVFSHPYVLLNKSKRGGWFCGLMTSDSDNPQILEPCQSRFFGEDNFFTKVLFVTANVTGYFMNTYDNDKHIKEVYKKLVSVMNDKPVEVKEEYDLKENLFKAC